VKQYLLNQWLIFVIDQNIERTSLAISVWNEIIKPWMRITVVMRKRYESPIFTLTMFATMALGMILMAVDPTGLVSGNDGPITFGSLSLARAALFCIGIGMVVLGAAIRAIGFISLRRNFSGRLRIREGHNLVTTGLYHYVRHPLYLGAIILFLGFPVMFSSILGFLTMLLLVPVLIHRIRLEEKMMVEHFGAEYEEYMKHSKKLVPFLY